MTKRLQYPNVWAEGGTATDPDLDTTHPSYEANRYTEKGWHAEKPPEFWQNFLTQITDQKVVERIIDGISPYDASITYPDGAMYRVSNKFYKMVNGAAKEILDPKATVYLSLVADAKALIDAHLLADNPHHDTVDTLVGGSYIKEDVDKFFGSDTDPKTIVYHKLRTGAVHSETPSQVGTIPTTGGNFTGDVTFVEEAIIQLSPSKYIHYNKATAIIEIVNGTYAMGVDAAGNGYLVGSAGTALIVTTGNLDMVTMRNNYRFAVPVERLSMNIEYDLSDGDSVANWTIETAAAPVFEEGKGFELQAANIVVGADIGSSHTVLVRGFTTKEEVQIFNVAGAKSYTDLNQFTDGLGFTHVKQIAVYPVLTSYQKSTLVNK